MAAKERGRLSIKCVITELFFSRRGEGGRGRFNREAALIKLFSGNYRQKPSTINLLLHVLNRTQERKRRLTGFRPDSPGFQNLK